MGEAVCTIESLRPGSKNHSLVVKVLDAKVVGTRKGPKGPPVKVAECLVGDETGAVVLVLKGESVEHASTGAYLSLKNAKVDVFRGSMRLVVDASKAEATDGPSFTPNTALNMSLIEFETIPLTDSVA